MIAIIYGTRPEFLKVYPIILEAQKRSIELITINTGQHTSMLTEMENLFEFEPSYKLEVQSNQFSNSNLLAKLIDSISEVIKKENIDKIIAQGDTFTVLASSMVAFLEQREFFHVEAGLRTDDIRFPFPEEYNRRVVSLTSKLNFAPTQLSKNNLLKENISEDKIVITGNTIIDLLNHVLKKYEIKIEKGNDVFITAHRRENISENMYSICGAIRELALENPTINFHWSLHPNPKTRDFIFQAFNEIPENIYFIEPLNYVEAVTLMAKSALIISDSGGIQEEAPTLQKRVLILREETERPEVIECGCGVLVGTDKNKIKLEFYKELNVQKNNFSNPFGDGRSSVKILNKI
ncbi:non-hydrolyzing UDP-N-acetylglucosamine 2-epimerase [Faecalibacter rhinopitheci]|uniref:UDP-N-acetylglucosamine 2-epimerase (non-hydrolyzing) n=1 Tax=Faecalibacter rhinopitheci TaxID=2779678 RepID=A0A8J7FQ89_9FLAO|nr:UDP-N-acetylglucosamine 2-epimerase (non-hydrolyzing) [Faecalibacter rhinopitheci]MBF0597489.1 UDP-N-acetylglucosamine 2-epimerase (non-hydrolyzing) [Faecalibacter rhinopitheci]